MSEQTVTINGEDITVRSLSLAQVRAVRKADEDHADVLAIAWSTGWEVDVAKEFFETRKAGDTIALLEAVFEVSGLTEGATFPG